MVEGSSLENYRARERAVGSNPTLSAISLVTGVQGVLKNRHLSRFLRYFLSRSSKLFVDR